MKMFEIETLIEYNVPWFPESLHPEQDLDPFSRFCTAQRHERHTDVQTPRTLVTILCISCIRCNLIIQYCMSDSE